MVEQITGRSLGGFVGACIGGAIIAPIRTIIKIVQCIKYLISTSKSIQKRQRRVGANDGLYGIHAGHEP